MDAWIKSFCMRRVRCGGHSTVSYENKDCRPPFSDIFRMYTRFKEVQIQYAGATSELERETYPKSHETTYRPNEWMDGVAFRFILFEKGSRSDETDLLSRDVDVYLCCCELGLVE